MLLKNVERPRGDDIDHFATAKCTSERRVVAAGTDDGLGADEQVEIEEGLLNRKPAAEEFAIDEVPAPELCRELGQCRGRVRKVYDLASSPDGRFDVGIV